VVTDYLSQKFFVSRQKMAQAARTYPLSAERVYDSSDEDEVHGVPTSNPKTSNGVKGTE
jgi:hypothetical protein